MFNYYKYLILLFLTFSSTNVFPEINKVINDYEYERSYSGIGGKLPFRGTFEFETLPVPLQEVHVNFTLSVNDTSDYLPKDDWLVKLTYSPKRMRVISDSVFVWSGLCNYGDQYLGSFSFIPLITGDIGFSFHLDGTDLLLALSVEMVFDLDGNLIALGKPNEIPSFNDIPYCTFFNQDSISILKESNPGTHDLANYSYVIKPPFRIGDTSTIFYQLIAVQNAYEGMNMILRSELMDIVSWPSRIEEPVHEGDTIILEVKVVPLPFRNVHTMILQVDDGNPDKRQVNSSIIPCFTIYHNSGELRLVSDISSLKEKENVLPLPTAYPLGKTGLYEEIIIPKEETGDIKHIKYK